MIFEELPNHMRVFGKSDNRSPHISRRKYSVFIPYGSGRTSVISNGNYGRNIVIGILIESIENIECPRSSSDGGDVCFHYFLTLRVDCIRLYRFYILINLFMDGTTLIILLVIVAVVIPMFIKKVSQGEL